jgi:uncharacterized protein (TIGR02594 family)
MFKKLLFIVLFLLSSYSHGLANINRLNPLEKALQYNQLHEVHNRKELKTLLQGIDPVRVPWCGLFIYSMYQDRGIKIKNPALARNWLSVGKKIEQPRRGDLVILSRGSTLWQGHIGFFIADFSIKGIDYILVYGGNQEDKVTYSVYKKKYLLGYRRIE